ncbi:MAG: putative amidohydrolase [Chloroflexi bacterium]|nr:putative amidohydrolase [Chloroflexota bacterium]
MEWHVVIVQTRPKKGDYQHSLNRLAATFAQLDDANEPTDILVLPEYALTGYFLQGGVTEVARPVDVMFHEVLDSYRRSTRRTMPNLDIVIGFPERYQTRLYNAVLYATLSHDDAQARIVHVHRKFFLPTYGVFDEQRYVNRGRHIDAFETKAGVAGMLICEDAWHSITGAILALRGVNVIYIPVASPARGFAGEAVSNIDRWHRLSQSIAEEHAIFVVTSNLVGFEGGKGFIGSSIVANPFGEILVEGPAGAECMLRATLDLEEIAIARASLPLLGDLESHLPDLLRELRAAGIPAEEALPQ